MDNESREAFEGSTLADELDLAEPTTEPGQRARLFLFPRALRAEAPLRNSQPMFELISRYVYQICGERLGFPDRLRDQENPADLYRSALLRSDGIPQYFVLGRCLRGISDRVRDQNIPPTAGEPGPRPGRCCLCAPGRRNAALRSLVSLDAPPPWTGGIAAGRRSGSLGRSPQARPVWGRVRALGLRWTLRHRYDQRRGT